MAPLGLTLNFLSLFTGLVDFMQLDPKKAGTYFSNQAVSNVAYIFSRFQLCPTQLSSITVSFRAGPRTVCAGVQRGSKANKKCLEGP